MKCLRCGTELKDSNVFCPQCSIVTAVPLQSSPYLSRKIHIPKRKPPQPPKKQEVKKPDQKETHPYRRILFCTLLLLLSVALSLQTVYLYREKEALSTELTRLHSVEDECVRLTDMLRQAEQEVADLEEELSNLGTDAYLSLRESMKATKGENERLTKELSRAKENIRNLEGQLEVLREKTEFFDTYIVFSTEENPKIFHSYDCEMFTHTGYRAYTKQQALFQGYSPCPHCQ